MDHFTYKDGVLFAEDVSLTELAAKHGTPFYCYSTATLQRHYRVFAEAFAGRNPLICFALKACSTLAVVKTLAAEGAGADVVSGGEIRIALAAGIPPSKIVFSGVGKTRAEMAYALEQDIFQFNVESEAELDALSEVATEMKKTARVALRVNPDVIAGTHEKISTGNKETKFGIPMRLAVEFYERAGKLPGIAVQGVSVHIGSQLTDLTPFAGAFTRVVELVAKLREKGIAVSTLDLGGGLGIPYKEESVPPLPAAYGQMVLDITHGLGVQLMFEPGRLLVGNAGVLVTRVLYLKRSEGRIFVIVDAGMNDLVRPAMYDAHHDIVPVTLSSAVGNEIVDVVGPVCETSDIFAKDRQLPLPRPGDLLAFRSSGAYGASMASTYNARPLLAEVLVNGAESAVIRPRQTYEELLARDALPGWFNS